jgi:hypothetical protein
MTDYEWLDFDNVFNPDGTEVYYVGEEHHNSHSEGLGRRVVRDTEPLFCGVESHPESSTTPSSGAMGAVVDFARENHSVLYRIDAPRSNTLGDFRSPAGFLEDANKFTHEVQSDGSVDGQAAHDTRERILTEYGMEAFYKLFTARDREMTAIGKRLAERDGATVLAVGAFHIPGIKLMWGDVSADGFSRTLHDREV